jgi:hypothetical protein
MRNSVAERRNRKIRTRYARSAPLRVGSSPGGFCTSVLDFARKGRGDHTGDAQCAVDRLLSRVVYVADFEQETSGMQMLIEPAVIVLANAAA